MSQFSDSAERTRKEKVLFLIGFLLIAGVAVSTFFRTPAKKINPANQDFFAKIDYPQISATDLIKKIRNKENAKILDTRAEIDFQTEHIADSVNFSLDKLKESSLPFGANDSIYILNYAGADAENNEAINILKNKNYNNVAVIVGGLDAWKSASGSALSFGNPSSFTDQAKVTFVSQEDFVKILKDKKDLIYILDVRNTKLFSENHIPGANNIFLDDLEKLKDKIPIGKEIYIYGDNELDGFQAGVRLYDLNIYSAKVIKEGFAKWKEKGNPVEQ